MYLTAEDKKLGMENYQEALSHVSRRAFLKGAAAGAAGLGGMYFGYSALAGNPVKVGFIGTGDEGSVLLTQHPPAFMDIVAVADLRPTNLQRAFDGDGNEHRVGLYKKLGVETSRKITQYHNHRDLLADPEIEAVVIAVPLNQHAQVTIDALNAGKHVLCEKLMAHNVTECKEMIAAAEKNHKLLAVGHQRHYSVLYENANDLVRSGMLGTIKFIRAGWHRQNSFPGVDSWNKPISKDDLAALSKIDLPDFGYENAEKLCHWRLYNSTGGGLMAELGSHQLDAASILLGKVHPIAVQGYGGRNFYGVKGVGSKEQQADTREINDHVYVIMEFPGPNYADDKHDKVVVTYSSLNTNRLEPYGETVFGSRGTMIVEQEQNVMVFKEAGPGSAGGGTAQRVTVAQGGDKPVLASSESTGPSSAAMAAGAGGPVSRGYTEEMEHFCHCIREGNFGTREEGGLRCPGTHAMADAIMALTSNLAMKLQRRIEFKEEWFDPKSPAVPEKDEQVVA